MAGAASGASPGAGGEWQSLKDEAAARTALGGREEAVGGHDRDAGPGGFVLELTTELAEALVEDGTGESVVFAQACDVEVFDADDGEVVDESGGELVQRVPSDIGYPHVMARQLEAGLGAVSGALLFARKAALEQALARQQRFVGLGSGYFLSGGERGQGGATEIDTHHDGRSGRDFRLGHFYRHADEPAIGLAGDGGRSDLAVEPQRFVEPHPSEFWDPDLLVLDLECVSVQVEAVVNALLVIARPPRSLGEKVAIPSPQLHQRTLGCAFGDLQHPRELLPLDRVQSFVDRHPIRTRHPWIHQR